MLHWPVYISWNPLTIDVAIIIARHQWLIDTVSIDTLTAFLSALKDNTDSEWIFVLPPSPSAPTHKQLAEDFESRTYGYWNRILLIVDDHGIVGSNDLEYWKVRFLRDNVFWVDEYWSIVKAVKAASSKILGSVMPA